MVGLKKSGIDCRPYFYPISDFPMYSKTNTPIAHEVCQKGIILPSYEELSLSEIDYVCECIISMTGYEHYRNINLELIENHV